MITCIPGRDKLFEINHFRNFQTSVTLTLDRVIRHTIVYRSATSVYRPNFVEIGQTFCWRMDVH